MKVKVLGNGMTWVERPDTQFLLDDKILIDTPTGCVKVMYGQVDLEKIKYIFITHFHQDHFMDLNILFDIFRVMDKKVMVFAPKSALSRLLKILKQTDNLRSTKKEVCKVLKFVDVKPNSTFKLEDYEVKVFSALHSSKYAFSYVFTKNVSVGFSGDTAYCKDFQRFMESCDIAFVDTAQEQNDWHLSVDDIKELKKQYPNKKLYSVHVNDKLASSKRKDIVVPKVGEEFEF